MENFDRKKHWENIYSTKELENCSWFQPKPLTSLSLIEASGIPKTARIIDIGGGDSFLADSLLERGFSDITVMDISEAALNRAKQRLGSNSDKIKWLMADAANFSAPEKYELWHDRAAFHFLTDMKDVQKYIASAEKSIIPGGTLIIGTFSETGPQKCSGIDIKQYSAEDLKRTFHPGFTPIQCINIDHPTPFNTSQNFNFCSFRKVN
jgi:ubiquinone/menaquinone biosynthesis C-methylase UbiE